ncbi:thioredoxin protein [Sporothrix schenckii 1099-18]|uniref:Thioredoxin protein n=1 Tax=Sporothrix schenckii 1099-18 TaxID=1397361 RepID=A0A0F2MHW5_SPOSC|nr:thioredoxin protein [Sporothrix schenckii 1099-18]KJR89293.1 thioredoxin protein [Sporothrix schenckii 1099-18]
MDVQLLVYDLSQGLARQMSMSFLGFQLDAIYHTSIELNGREYVYDGGILAIQPYSSHLGHPFEKVPLGTTTRTVAAIEAHLDTLRPRFTAAAYDLFRHNCNTFTDEFAHFLVGHGIPAHITGMPDAVLATPMGRMLLPQLMQSGVTRGRGNGGGGGGGSLLGLQETAQPAAPVPASAAPRSTAPTHRHHRLTLPSFANVDAARPVLFSKVPPLDKLLSKLGDEVAQQPAVRDLRIFLEGKAAANTKSVSTPDLAALGRFVRESVPALPRTTLFAAVDLFRCSLADPRVSAFFGDDEADHGTVKSVVSVVNSEDAPYALRLVTLQMVCNLFGAPPAAANSLLADAALRAALVQLVAASFLDDAHASARSAASSLLFNMAITSRRSQSQSQSKSPGLAVDDQVELAASVVEAIGQEEASAGALQGMLAALGHLVYGAPLDGELADLLRVLDAAGVVAAKAKAFPDEPLVAEVGTELLGKGFVMA